MINMKMTIECRNVKTGLHIEPWQGLLRQGPVEKQETMVAVSEIAEKTFQDECCSNHTLPGLTVCAVCPEAQSLATSFQTKSLTLPVNLLSFDELLSLSVTRQTASSPIEIGPQT